MHPPGPAPLLAAGFDWLEAVLPLLFVVFWIVSQVVNLVRQVAGAGRPPRVDGDARARPAIPPGDPRGKPRADLERQIEEFLQQSRGGRLPATPPASAPPRQAKRPAMPRTTHGPTVKTAASRRPPAVTAKQAKLADRHLQPLGEAGDDVAEHVEGAFAHDLGHRVPTLAPSDGTAMPVARGSSGSPMATELASALRDPATLRRLILMREILDRPADRWE